MVWILSMGSAFFKTNKNYSLMDENINPHCGITSLSLEQHIYFYSLGVRLKTGVDWFGNMLPFLRQFNKQMLKTLLNTQNPSVQTEIILWTGPFAEIHNVSLMNLNSRPFNLCRKQARCPIKIRSMSQEVCAFPNLWRQPVIYCIEPTMGYARVTHN